MFKREELYVGFGKHDDNSYINTYKCINKCNNYYIINPLTFNIQFYNDKKNNYCSIFPYQISYNLNLNPEDIDIYNISKYKSYICESKKCKKKDFKNKDNYTNPLIELVLTKKMWLKMDFNIDSFDDAIEVITKRYINNDTYYYLTKRIIDYSLNVYYKKIFLLNNESINVFIYLIKNKWIPNILKKNENIEIDYLEILSIDYVSNFVITFLQNKNKKIKKMDSVLDEMEMEYTNNILKKI